MTESQEKGICNFIKECRQKKAIGTNSLVRYAGKLNPNFESKSIHTKLIWCYSVIDSYEDVILPSVELVILDKN